MNFEIKEFYKGVFEELQAKATKEESSQPVNILDYYLLKLENAEEKEEYTSTSFNEELLPYTKWSVSIHGLEAHIEVILHETKEYIARHFEEFVHALGRAEHVVITYLEETYRVVKTDLIKAIKELIHLMEIGWHKFEEALHKGKDIIVAFAHRVKSDVDDIRQRFLVTNALVAEGVKLESLSKVKGKGVREVSYYMGMLYGAESIDDMAQQASDAIHQFAQNLSQDVHKFAHAAGQDASKVAHATAAAASNVGHSIKEHFDEAIRAAGHGFKEFLHYTTVKFLEATEGSEKTIGHQTGDLMNKIMQMSPEKVKEKYGLNAEQFQQFALLLSLGIPFVYGVYLGVQKLRPAIKLLKAVGLNVLLYASFVVVMTLSYINETVPPALHKLASNIDIARHIGVPYGEGLVESRLTFIFIAFGITASLAGIAIGSVMKDLFETGKRVAKASKH